VEAVKHSIAAFVKIAMIDVQLKIKCQVPISLAPTG